MASVKKFEDLICWQEGRGLVNFIYQLTRKRQFSDFSLKDQILRAAVSIISNIAEGFERGTKDEFIYFLYIAKASCGEVRAQLYIALDQEFIDKSDFQKAHQQAKRISAMIYRLIESLKVSRFKGLKHKAVERKNKLEVLLQKDFPEIHEKLYTKIG